MPDHTQYDDFDEELFQGQPDNLEQNEIEGDDEGGLVIDTNEGVILEKTIEDWQNSIDGNNLEGLSSIQSGSVSMFGTG